MKRTAKKKSAAELEAQARFRSLVLAKGRCHICTAPSVDPHHILPKSFLRTHTSTLEDSERWQIVHDPRNGIPLCSPCHARVTSRFRPLLDYELPQIAKDFAEEQGLTWRLEKECPDAGDFWFGKAA